MLCGGMSELVSRVKTHKPGTLSLSKESDEEEPQTEAPRGRGSVHTIGAFSIRWWWWWWKVCIFECQEHMLVLFDASSSMSVVHSVGRASEAIRQRRRVELVCQPPPLLLLTDKHAIGCEIVRNWGFKKCVDMAMSIMQYKYTSRGSIHSIYFEPWNCSDTFCHWFRPIGNL